MMTEEKVRELLRREKVKSARSKCEILECIEHGDYGSAIHKTACGYGYAYVVHALKTILEC